MSINPLKKAHEDKTEKNTDAQNGTVLKDKNEKDIALLKAEAVEKYGLSDETKAVLDCIDEASADVDLIALKTGLSVSDILVSLTELEMYGIIEKTGSRSCRFIRP